ncbi:MAG TPA: HlyD family type I secretion periplasmic adaptor subunit, partial [bacterium]|nr:HlyD family type I secretion periplasmic adaptor subunit [bacterium]
HLEGGIVKQVNVKEGDEVTVGDVVAQLDDTQARAQLEIVRSQLIAYRLNEARLLAERDGTSEVAFPQDLLELAKTDPKVDELLQGQIKSFDARLGDLNSRVKLLDEKISQLNQQIRDSDAQEKILLRRIDLFSDELNGLRSLLDKGLGDKVRLRALERDKAEVEGILSDVRARRSQAKLQISEAKLQITQTRQEFVKNVVAELNETQVKIGDSQERERALADTLRRTEVLAPVSGRVVALDVHTEGAVLPPGGKIMDIVPQAETLLVDAHVSPADVDKVVPGLVSRVRFTAFNQRTTPTVLGKVLSISADRLTDPTTNMPYYLARIQISPEEMATLKGLELIPGMPADVMIVTGERTVLDYMLRPLLDALARSFKEE